jgi:hypothetical protein
MSAVRLGIQAQDCNLKYDIQGQARQGHTAARFRKNRLIGLTQYLGFMQGYTALEDNATLEQVGLTDEGVVYMYQRLI